MPEYPSVSVPDGTDVEVSLAGIDDTGVADVGAAINAVYAGLTAQDTVRWNPRGIYRSTVPILITCGTEADGALVRADHNGDAVVVGTDAVEPFNVTIKLPDIEKVTQTWASSPVSITADVGLRVHSANACRIHWPYIRRFATSVVMDPGPATGSKVAYCTFYPGRTDLTARNWLVAPSGNGFANQNTVIGGEPKHQVGSALAGTYQLKMTTTGAFQPDNWTFIGSAFEGDGPEWHVDACASFLIFLNCRWEHNVRSRVRANAISGAIYAHDWKILGGFDAAKLIPTLVSPAKCIEVNSEGSHRRSFNDALGGMTLNSVVSSATALITLVSVAADIWGIDPLAAYNVVLAATGIKLKQTADTQPRLDIAQDGILSWGSGAAAADVNLFRQGIDLLRTNDEFQAARELVARVGSANGQVRAGAVGPSSVAAVLFGSAEDVNLYRPSANLLKTDDKLIAALGIGVGNSAAATTPGSVTRKMEVFDAAGASLGFVPIYGTIT